MTRRRPSGDPGILATTVGLALAGSFCWHPYCGWPPHCTLTSPFLPVWGRKALPQISRPQFLCNVFHGRRTDRYINTISGTQFSQEIKLGPRRTASLSSSVWRFGGKRVTTFSHWTAIPYLNLLNGEQYCPW